MSSPCRTTSLLVSKESDGWIAYKSREKEDTLSLKPNENGYWIFFLFFLLTFGLLLCFIPYFCFSFLFLFSHLISLSFLLIFSSLFGQFLTLFGATTHPVKGRKLPPHFLKLKVWLSLFHISFVLFLNDIITTWLHMGHRIPFLTHGSLRAILSSGPHGFAKCHSLMVPYGISLPCHVSSNTSRLEKREIPTTSKSNEIRRGSSIS